MPTEPASAFVPDHAVRPGLTLLETIESLGLTQADVAERTGRPKKTINEIINGKAAITPETALQLERVLGVPAVLWTRLEQNYRTALAKQEERERLGERVDWIKRFPVTEMVKRGWLRSKGDKVDQLQQLLSYFGVATPEAWSEVWAGARQATAFRAPKENADNFGVVATWLRQGELVGQKIQCAPYSAPRFREALKTVRAATTATQDRFCQILREECAAAGVAVAIVQELPRLGVCGAARWLGQDKALIQLSFYYKRDDQFWFSFFHEAAHILLHGKREVFVDDRGTAKSDIKEEEEANQFAADHLIDDWEYRVFTDTNDFAADAIEAFAKKQGIAPGIVVGRLQRERFLRHGERQEMFRPLTWDELD